MKKLISLFAAVSCIVSANAQATTLDNADNDKGVKTQVSQGDAVKETAMFRLPKKAHISLEGGKATMRLGDDDHNVAELPLKNGAKMHIALEDYDAEAQSHLTATVSSAGYSTLYSAFQLTVPSGVDVYAPEYVQSSNVLRFENKLAAGTVLPAGTGLLLKNAGTYNFAYSEAQPADVTSALTGSVVSAPVEDFAGTIYSLAKEDGVVAFYKYSQSTTVGGKAFLVLPAAQAKKVTFDFGNSTTSVNEMESAEPTDATTYNLSGQQVMGSYRGIIIQNGKKKIRR